MGRSSTSMTIRSSMPTFSRTIQRAWPVYCGVPALVERGRKGKPVERGRQGKRRTRDNKLLVRSYRRGVPFCSDPTSCIPPRGLPERAGSTHRQRHLGQHDASRVFPATRMRRMQAPHASAHGRTVGLWAGTRAWWRVVSSREVEQRTVRS